MALVAVGAAWFARLGERDVQGPFKIVDGDSLEAASQRYRLKGIDAPEYTQTCRKNGADWPCGREAARHLRRLVDAGSTVCSGGEVDKFGRLLVVCHAGDVQVNRQMVLQGWAVSFGAYEAEERLARRNESGLWAGEFERPREWRELHGRVVEEQGASLLDSLVNRGRLWLQSVSGWLVRERL
ncbi:thermonuclease family protein [Salaquimonas pukyongi]|uniref:thermonuclease family protein n=1 Tax=Salaquimonas pukyongi TaxID=2712698 RepID=UPI00096BAFC9|nr:thermonuclease family protein [Salaquimonas pukyongi]